MSYTQENRIVAIETSLGTDVLLLASLAGEEGISSLFRFELFLLSERGSVPSEKIIGQRVNIRVTMGDGSARYINGFVSRFVQCGAHPPFTQYQMEVVPWLWFLTRHADCRIFQNMTIPQIIEQVFKDRGFTDYKSGLTAVYEQREYCVQYRETDFHFVSRLMEEYGIFYFFEHENDKHTLVLADSPSACKPCPGQGAADYNVIGGTTQGEDVIQRWDMSLELHSGKYSMTDYNFETPAANMRTSEVTVMEYAKNNKLEIYDYPGKYPKQSDGSSLAKVRMQEHEAGVKVARGEGNCRSFITGHRFELRDHPILSMNESYMLTTVSHEFSAGRSYLTEGESDEFYSNKFHCIPAKVTFRPLRLAPRPFVHGPQTAVVVGPKGEEIWVDKYGRVKVQFFWDRLGKHDENSSCWIRVSQAWAGKNWGAMWIPRIGQEVIVSFLEGDPDRPIITGRVYNADQEVPYELPEYSTRSTFLSRSSKDGETKNFNEIRFEDKKGSEQVFVNAEKDMDLRVEKESREFVGADRHLIVQGDQKEQVGGSWHSKISKDSNQEVEANMSLKVNGNRQLEVEGEQREKFDAALHSDIATEFNQKVGLAMSLQVGETRNEKTGMVYAHQAGMMIHLKSDLAVVIEAGAELTLKVGASFISMSPASISIQSPIVLINSGGAAGDGPGSSPQNPATADPTSPQAPDTADDGSKGTKLN